MKILGFVISIILFFHLTQVVHAEELDSDHDGLPDRVEQIIGTDLNDSDTDRDGYLDGQEFFQGYTPTSTLPTRLQKTIQIHLDRSQLEERINNIAIKSYPISPGLPRTPTPIGTFRVLQKTPRAWSAAAGLWMPWWMHFSGRGHGIHELPEWPGGKKEGANHLGHAASHGCVRLGIGPAKELYDWTPIGTPVIITKK